MGSISWTGPEIQLKYSWSLQHCLWHNCTSMSSRQVSGVGRRNCSWVVLMTNYFLWHTYERTDAATVWTRPTEVQNRMLARKRGSRHKVAPLTKELFAIDTFWEKENKQTNQQNNPFSPIECHWVHQPYARAYPMPTCSQATQDQILSYCVCDFCLGFDIFFLFYRFFFPSLFCLSVLIFLCCFCCIFMGCYFEEEKEHKVEWGRRWDGSGRSWGEENSDQDTSWKTFLNIFK